MAVYVGDGQAVDYTPSAAVPAGAVVVQGSLVGIAVRPIAANTLGSVAVRGVFDVEKAPVAVEAGAVLYWNVSAGRATTSPTGGVLMGFATVAAAQDAATVRVALGSFPPPPAD